MQPCAHETPRVGARRALASAAAPVAPPPQGPAPPRRGADPARPGDRCRPGGHLQGRCPGHASGPLHGEPVGAGLEGFVLPVALPRKTGGDLASCVVPRAPAELAESASPAPVQRQETSGARGWLPRRRWRPLSAAPSSDGARRFASWPGQGAGTEAVPGAHRRSYTYFSKHGEAPSMACAPRLQPSTGVALCSCNRMRKQALRPQAAWASAQGARTQMTKRCEAGAWACRASSMSSAPGKGRQPGNAATRPKQPSSRQQPGVREAPRSGPAQRRKARRSKTSNDEQVQRVVTRASRAARGAARPAARGKGLSAGAASSPAGQSLL